MIPVSTDYRQQLIAGNRNWVISIPVFLKGNSTSTPDFTLTNEHIWDNGIVLDEAISSDNSFDIGAAIVGSLKVVIDNINGSFSHYDFFDARLTLWLGVEGDLDEYDVQRLYRIGFYVVDVPSYNGSLITLNCLDNMIWFDTPFKDVTGINWNNATAGSIIQKICQHVGVSLANPSFPNYTTTIAVQPEQEMTCREVIQYLAQMCCCYCKIDKAGHLYLNWHDKNAIAGLVDYDGGTYDTHTTPYSDGDDVQGGRWYWDGENYIWEDLGIFDGGTFEQLRDRAFISQNYEIEVSTDDIYITGCRVRSNRSKENSYDVTWVSTVVEADHERYVLVIDDNPFIHNEAKASEIANVVGQTLAGLQVRGFSSSSLADFSYETGDMATVVDFRGNRYYTWITHFTFTTNNSERFSCGVQSIKKRGEQRFSMFAETIEKAKVAIKAYDAAVKEMNVLAQNAIGYNEYIQNVGGASIMYRYNGSSHTTSVPPKFQGSTVVFKISGDGVFVAKGSDIAPDGSCTFSNGYDANTGTGILNLLYVQGLNADWINAGSIDADRIKATVIQSINSATGTTTINGGKINIAGVVSGINTGSTTIDGGKISTNTITANQIASGAIDTDELAANAVTSGKIKAGEVKATNIATDAVEAGKIKAGAVTTSKLDAGAVTADKISVTNLDAISVNIGPWIIDSQGFTNQRDAWLTPMNVACGRYGGTLVGMRGKDTGDNYGYLEVGVNDGKDCIRVGYNDIRKYNASGGYVTVNWNSSDRRLKKNIKNLSLKEAKELIAKVKPRKFELKSEKGTRYGFIAQELREVLNDDCAIEYGEDDEKAYRAVHYDDFIAPLCLLVRKQQEEIDLLKQEVELLKKKVGE